MKRLLFLIITLALILSLSIVISAEETNDLPGESVYLSEERQDEIEVCFDGMPLEKLKENDCIVLKESLTPVYILDPVEYLETGKVILNLAYYSYNEEFERYVPVCKPLGTETNIYAAKCVNRYGNRRGDVFLYMNEQNEAVECVIQPISVKVKRDYSKTSFAEHKVRIEKLLQSQVTEEDVRLVIIAGISLHGFYYDYGTAFYVNNGVESALIGLNGSNLIFGVETKQSEDWPKSLKTPEIVYEREFETLFSTLKERRMAENDYIDKYDNKDFGYVLQDFYVDSSAKSFQGNHSINSIYHINNISEYLATGKLSQDLPDAEKIIGSIEENPNADPIITETIVSNVESESGDDITPAPQKTATTEHILCVTAICILSVVLIVFVMLTARKRKAKE